MELRHLRYLVALANEGQFTRAAQRLHVAQPALSQQIARLEQELGVTLVDRTTRRVTLTAAGRRLVAHARDILAQADLARAEISDIAGLRTGEVVIGVTFTMGALDLPAILAAFHATHAAIDLILREDLSVALIDAVRRDELDVAFVSTIADGLESRVLASEDLVIALPPDHRLAGRHRLPIAALRDSTFVGFRPGATLRRQIDDAAQAAGYAPTIAFETNDLFRMRSLVSVGLGVALLPRSDAERPGPAVRVIELADEPLRHTTHIVWRAGKRHAPATRAFIDAATAARPVSSPPAGQADTV